MSEILKLCGYTNYEITYYLINEMNRLGDVYDSLFEDIPEEL